MRNMRPLLEVSSRVDWRFRVAPVIAHETGHRIGSIRQLRWADIDMEARMPPKAGNSPVFPASKDPSRCLDRSRVRVWWDKAQKLAGLEPRRGRGLHSLRRKFASDLMSQPLKVLCELGGWKTALTVLQCYQRADEDRLRKALEDRRRPGSRTHLADINSGHHTPGIP